MKQLVDVIVPVYNVEKYLSRFFDSLLHQTIQDFRIIVVYDNGDDDSLSVLKKYELIFGLDRFVILLSPKKNGLGAARDFALNSGLLNCEYVSFLDPDDSLENTYFEKMINSIRQNDSDICICGFNRVDEDSQSIIKVDMVSNPSVIDSPLSYYATSFFNTSVWNKLYKYSLIKDIRFTSVKRSEDVCYFVSTFSKARRISFVNEPLYNYLLRSTSLASSYSIKHIDELLELVKTILPSFDKAQKKFFADVLFIRFAIGTVQRITSNNKKDGKIAAKRIRKFLLHNFDGFCSFSNISFFSSLKKGKMVFAVYCLRKLYRFSKLFLFIKMYVRRAKKKKMLSW